VALQFVKHVSFNVLDFTVGFGAYLLRVDHSSYYMQINIRSSVNSTLFLFHWPCSHDQVQGCSRCQSPPRETCSGYWIRYRMVSCYVQTVALFTNLGFKWRSVTWFHINFRWCPQKWMIK